MVRQIAAPLAVLLALVALPGPAVAERVHYEMTGDATASFILSSDGPTWIDAGLGFGYYNVQGTFDGHYYNDANVMFPLDSNGGGIEAVTADWTIEFFSGLGPQLFSGSMTGPTLLTGEWDMTDYYFPERSYHLSATAVPEPVSWALMLGGFGAIGSAMRRRRRLSSSNIVLRNRT